MGQVILKKEIKVAVPLLGVGGGQTINQVDANIFKTSLFGPIEALAGVIGVVFAAEVLQIVVEKALNADAQPIDANLV